MFKFDLVKKKIDPPRLAFVICGSKECLVNMSENKKKKCDKCELVDKHDRSTWV